MSLLDTIKADQLAARKAKDANKSSLLTTLIGDVQNIFKGPYKGTEEEVILSTIKKYLDTNKEFQDKNPEDHVMTVLKQEMEILKSYMPSQLTQDEILSIIQKESLKELPAIMKYFKTNYLGKYDGKQLSDIAKGISNV